MSHKIRRVKLAAKGEIAFEKSGPDRIAVTMVNLIHSERTTQCIFFYENTGTSGTASTI